MGDAIDIRFNESIHLDKYSKRWSDILLGNQFLKLYFYENGISSSLVVNRMIKADDLRIIKPNEDFKFLIIKSKPNEKNIDLDNNNDSEDKKFSYSRSDYESYEKAFEENEFLFFSKIKNYFSIHQCDFVYKHQSKKIIYSFVEDHVMNLNTEKILQLAYSGFFNLYNDKESLQNTKYFKRENTPIMNFFEKMKSFLKSKKEKENLVKSFNYQVNENNNNKRQNINDYFSDNEQANNFDENDNIVNVNNINEDANLNNQKSDKKNYFNQEIISHYAEKILRLEMSEAHKNAVKNIRGENSNPLYSNDDYSGNYSLFFLRDDTLWEWRQFSGKLLTVGRNIKPEFAKELIYNYIKTQNTESEIFYEDDITIFAELTDQPLENIEATSKNCSLTLILTIIFLINFFVVFPQQAFYDIRRNFSSYGIGFLTDDSGEALLQTVDNMKNVIGNKFLEQWFDNFYIIQNETSNITNSTDSNSTGSTKSSKNKNENSINYITDDVRAKLLAQTLGVLPSFNLTELNRTIYIRDVNIYSGMLLSFEYIKFTNASTSSGNMYSDIPLSTLNYYDVKETSEINMKFNNKSDYLTARYNEARKRYEIYCRPYYTDNEIKVLRENIQQLFDRKLYKFEVTVMLFNIDYNALYSFTVTAKIDAFANLVSNFYFNAMMPFIKFSTGLFILIIVLSIVFVLGMVYLAFGNVANFISSIFDSINTKSYQIDFREIFDLSIILLNLVSQIYFMVLFIFPSDLFPLKTSNKDEFDYWKEKINSVDMYQKITGVAIFFMIVRLLKFMMVAFPSFGIVFQTLKFAYKEILAFFLLVCLMLGGIGSLAHSSFGYYSSSYSNLSWSYFQVYLMFVGIFDIAAITNDEISNPLAPVFFVVFMIIFNLILINLFISIILNNYREVKEKYQNFNNVYSIMVQEKIEELTTKLWDLVIFKHPQQVEWEQKKKKGENNNINFIKNNSQIEPNNDNNYNDNLNNLNNLDNENFKENKKNLAEEKNEVNFENKTIKPKFSKITFWEKLKYNFKRLNLKQLLLGESWNKEEFNTKKIGLLQKMEIKNLEETIKQYAIDYDNEFSHLAKTVFYIFYIVIFILMMDYQLRLNANYPVKYHFNSKFSTIFKTNYDSFLSMELPLFNFVDSFYDAKITVENTTKRKKTNSRINNSNNINENKYNGISEYINDNYDYLNNTRKIKLNDNYLNSRNLLDTKLSNSINNDYYYQTANETTSPNNNKSTNFNETNTKNSNETNQDDTNNSLNENNDATAASKLKINLHVNFTNDCKMQINQLKVNKYIALNQPFFRFTYRLYSVGVNSDENTLKIFPFIANTNQILNQDNCESDPGEYTSTILFNEEISKHTKPGEYSSAFNCGGYVFNLGKEPLGCGDRETNFMLEQMDNILNLPNLNSAFLEFPLFNIYEDFAVLNTFSFVKKKLGEIEYTKRFDLIPINRYVTKNDFIRTILECLFLIISIFYLSFILGNIFKYFLDSFNNDFENDESKENFRNSFFLNKLFRINFNKFKNKGLLKSLCEMINTIIWKLLKAIFWLLESLFSYLRSDGYNILDFIYFIITISMIFAWYSILSITNSLNFEQSIDPINQEDYPKDNIQLLSLLRDSYNSYFLFQAINGFILFLRILGVFKFSQSINNLMSVIYRAKQVVIFHVFSMIFFNIGFCFAGYAIFSQNIKEFNSLSSSFLQVLIIVQGNVNMKMFQNENWLYSALFILLITFSNYLILLNILLSVVVHAFYDVKNENKINFGTSVEEDFITKIRDIIYKKFLLIFERIEVYFTNVLFYGIKADQKISQLKSEMKESSGGNKRNKEESNNKASLDNKTKKLNFYELLSNLKNEIDELSNQAEKCVFSLTKDIHKNPTFAKKDNNSSSNSEIKIPKISIIEKIFTYIYLILFQEIPNVNYLFEKHEETKQIKSENPFYSQRFINDKLDTSKKDKIIKINNLYNEEFLNKFKQDINKKSNNFFNKAYFTTFREYLIARESFKQQKEQKPELKRSITEIYYNEKSREPLDNFDNLIYPDDLYKIEKTSFNKILNIIIFCDQKRIRLESNTDISNIYNITSEDQIYIKANFADILNDKFKVLKHLKFISMTYDLVVKHYYMPNNISYQEKNAYLGFYLQKFLERQFNQIEIQYLNQNIYEIKDSLFEKDILKLFEFELDIAESKYADKENFDDYIRDEFISIRNEAFSEENDFDEFADKYKKRKVGDKTNENKSYLTTNNNIYNNTKRFNDNFNDRAETINNNNNKKENGFNNAINLISTKIGNFNTKAYKENKYFHSDRKMIEEENMEELVIFKEKCLKIYSIWNTLFIILFRKNIKYVKFLENLSFSKQLINQYKEQLKFENFNQNDICFESPYLYLFSRLFFLEQPLSKDHEKQFDNNKNIKLNSEFNFVFKKIDKNIKKLNEVRLLGKLDENDITTPSSFFYTDMNEYLFNPEYENFEENIKKSKNKSLNSYHYISKFNNFYPIIFSKIWSNLIESIKKALFFGLSELNYALIANNKSFDYSKPIFYEEIIKNVIERNEISEEKIKNTNKHKQLKIISFFRSEQRSHIFNYLNFPSEKFDECKKAILALPSNVITMDDIEGYKNFESLFKFINESKFNLKYIYDVYNAIFDKLFKDLKIKLREVTNEYEKLLLSLIDKNREFFENSKNRVKFIKFFKYIIVMKKYDTIKECIKETSNKINNDTCPDKENIDNIIKDNELFIYVLSLSPIDFIEIIRKCKKQNLKETLIYLFIYMHSGTKEFQNSMDYLKKFIRTELIIKYDKYGKLFETKGKMKSFEDRENENQKKYGNMQEYKTELLEKIKELELVRNKTMDELEKKLKVGAEKDKKEEDN